MAEEMVGVSVETVKVWLVTAVEMVVIVILIMDENGGGSAVTNDIIKAVTKAFQLNDEVNGSQQNFLSIWEACIL